MRHVCMKSAPRGMTDGTGSLLLSGNDTQNGSGFGGTPGISRSHAISPAPGSFCDDMLPCSTSVLASKITISNSNKAAAT